MTITLTKKQYELLCECIRYRAADNEMEYNEAVKRGMNTAYYYDIDNRISELKSIIYGN